MSKRNAKLTKRRFNRSGASRVMPTRRNWAVAICSLAALGICGTNALYAQTTGIRSVAYAAVDPLELNHEFDLNDDASESDGALVAAPAPGDSAPSPNFVGLESAPSPESSPNADLTSSDDPLPESPARRPRRVSRPINVPDTIPKSSSRPRTSAPSYYAPSSAAYAPARPRVGVLSNAVGAPVAQSAPGANQRLWFGSGYVASARPAAPRPARVDAQPAPAALPASTQTAGAAPAARERIASIAIVTPGTPAEPTSPASPAAVETTSPAVAAPDAAYAEDAQAPAPAENPAEAASPETPQSAESLDDAIRIALAQSRTQQALAYKRRAAESTARAASTLRNPKINNTTSYIGVLNKPTTVSEVDTASALSQVASALPPDVAAALAPTMSALPTSLQVATPLTDRNFVTSATSITIPIYLGGRIRALEEAAQAMTQAVAAGEEIGEQTVKIETVEAYFLVLRARRLREVAQEAVESAQSHLKDAERMFNVGMVTKNVELAAQVALSEAKQLELKVANAQALAESAYNRLMWRPLDAPVNIADMDLVAPLGNLESLTELALRSRSELQALAAETRAINAQVRVARADVLPQVAAGGAYAYFENSHLKDNSNATAAIGVSWTPFDGGTSRARQNAARQNAMAVARARDEVESAIRLEVRQATLAESEARERLEVARVAADQAEENYRVVTRGFQEGMLNHTEVLDATTMRTAAKSSLANARYDAILATERLKRAVGIL